MKCDLFYITEQDRNVKKRFYGSFDLKEFHDGDKVMRKSLVLKNILSASDGDYLLIETERNNSRLFDNSLSRFLSAAKSTDADILYSDYLTKENGKLALRETIAYQNGSVRDDFDFGGFVFIKRRALEKYFEQNGDNLEFSAFYDFRLFVSRTGKIFRIPEPLYLTTFEKNRKTGESVFDYVKSEFRRNQKEHEKVFTRHLRLIGAYLPRREKRVEFDFSKFPVKASVVIPVKNRVRTIAEAINSALSQKTDFEFNVIVVENHSNDGTAELLAEISSVNKKVITITPREKHLGIGGCWNLAVNDNRCGAFAVQLDSDDKYLSDGSTLRKIVETFMETNAAALVGSYVVTDFDLNEIPPGKVLHDEWSFENGHNNALRINGFGAPRAYYTPIIREVGFPDVSYGEDYAAMLAITRQYFLARIFEPLYYARRWEGNSDADLPWEKKNKYDYYKDFLRTIEISERIKLNASSQ